jgi:hypothetical protein
LDVQGFGLFKRVALTPSPPLQTNLWIPPPVLAATQVVAAVGVAAVEAGVEVGVASPPAAAVGVAAEMENPILLFVPRFRVPVTRKRAWIGRSLSSFASRFEWHAGLGIGW